jgi:hypothetical protein
LTPENTWLLEKPDLLLLLPFLIVEPAGFEPNSKDLVRYRTAPEAASFMNWDLP